MSSIRPSVRPSYTLFVHPVCLLKERRASDASRTPRRNEGLKTTQSHLEDNISPSARTSISLTSYVRAQVLPFCLPFVSRASLLFILYSRCLLFFVIFLLLWFPFLFFLNVCGFLLAFFVFFFLLTFSLMFMSSFRVF